LQPPKKPSLGENTSYDPQTVKIYPRVRPRKKYSITDQLTIHMSQNYSISPIWGEAPAALTGLK